VPVPHVVEAQVQLPHQKAAVAHLLQQRVAEQLGQQRSNDTGCTSL
jgi:hypothetical protein